jgi:glycosyltransferase involved in cell wall biosynthesis
MKNSFYLTIIIPTIGRIKEVKALLDSLEKFKPSFLFEVIIVDQNEVGFLDIALSSCSLDNLSHKNVKFKGLSKAKNFGIELARGEWICFPDDDCLFLESTLNEFYSCSLNSKSDIIFGKCIDENGKDSVIKFKNDSFQLNINNMNGGFIEATAFVKSNIANLYLFDEQMGAGCFHGAEEGYDWLYRLLINNNIANFQPKIKFYHPQVISVLNKGSKESLRRVFAYRCGFGYLCRKHKFISKFLKRLLLVMFSVPFFVLINNKTKAKYYSVEFIGLITGILVP